MSIWLGGMVGPMCHQNRENLIKPSFMSKRDEAQRRVVNTGRHPSDAAIILPDDSGTRWHFRW